MCPSLRKPSPMQATRPPSWHTGLYEVEECPLKMHVHPGPQSVTLFGNETFVAGASEAKGSSHR